MRVHRHEQDAVAALGEQVLDRRLHRRLAVAHGPIDDDAIPGDGAQMLLRLLGLGARDGLERAFVAGLVPDQVVVAALLLGPRLEDDQVEDRPPQPPRRLDHALVGEELAQIGAHRPIARRLRRAEIHDQHTEPARPHLGVVARQANGSERGVALGPVSGEVEGGGLDDLVHREKILGLRS